MTHTATHFSPYDPNQFQNLLSNNLMAPYQAPQQAFNTPDTFGINAAFQGGYDPSQFDFGPGGGAPGSTQGGGTAWGDFMNKWGAPAGQTLNAASSLFNLYGGIKSLGLMSKQFKLAKKATRLGIENQAIAYDNTIEQQEAAERASAGAGAGGPSTAEFERMKRWGG